MGYSERLGEMRREAEARHRAVLADQGVLASREFTGEAADGSVRASVDGDGAVNAVRVNPRRFDTVDGDALARQVVEAVRAARRAAKEGMGDVRERLPHGDPSVLRRLRDDVASAPPASSAEERTPDSDGVDRLMYELRRFREELPRWADALAEQQASGESVRGSVRAYCAASGKITRLEIDTYFPRTVRPEQAEAAILTALRRAQAAATRAVTAHQEKLQFMGLPIGEVISGKRSLPDLLGDPGGRPRPPAGEPQ